MDDRPEHEDLVIIYSLLLDLHKLELIILRRAHGHGLSFLYFFAGEVRLMMR